MRDPAELMDPLVDHFSIPAFDADRLPEVGQPSAIKSAKFTVVRPSVLVSRLNPATSRVWYAVPGSRPALASTEFLVLRDRSDTRLGALWLAVRTRSFLQEMRRRATGTSGSHQRLKPADAMSIEIPDIRGMDRQARTQADDLLQVAYKARIESRTLAALRDALLPELLSDRLRVPEAREQLEALM